MKTRPRDIGTRAESAVVRYLHTAGFPHAERRALRGNLDAGDITGCPGICWEVKGGDAAKTASDLTIERWMAELRTETVNADAAVGVLVVQRAGVGPGNAGRWWAYMPAVQLAELMFGTEVVGGYFPVRMLLADAVTLLRAAGYGAPAVDPNGCTDPGHPRTPAGRCPVCHGDGTEPAPLVVPYQGGRHTDIPTIDLLGQEAS